MTKKMERTASIRCILDTNYVGKIENYPAGYHLLVVPETMDEFERDRDGNKVLASGLVLPKDQTDAFDRAQMSQWTGTVIAIAPNCYLDFSEGHLWCRPGDVVRIAQNAGKWVYDEVLKREVAYILDKDIVGFKTKIPPGWTQEEYESVVNGQ